MTNLYHVKVPHVGEGIRSVQVLRLLASEGEWVDEDMDLVEIETDKAVIEIPSMASGKIKKILCKVGDIVDVGRPLMEIEEKGKKLEFISNQVRRGDIRIETLEELNAINPKFPPRQRVLAQNLKSSSDIVIGSLIEKAISFSSINYIRSSIRSTNAKHTPSCLSIIALATLKAMEKFDKFKCQLDRSMSLIESVSCCIGIAVAREMDTLDVPSINYMKIPSLEGLHSDIIRRLGGENVSGHAEPSLIISDMSSYGIQRANPVVVYPAVATLFIGTPYFGFDYRGQKEKMMNLCLAFDHRLINGAYAANFLAEIERSIKTTVVLASKKAA